MYELSDLDRVARYLGATFMADDQPEIESALKVAREQITAKVVEGLEAPFPESLHLACTIRAVELIGNQSSRYGYQEPLDEAGRGGLPPQVQVLRLLDPYRRSSIAFSKGSTDDSQHRY